MNLYSYKLKYIIIEYLKNILSKKMKSTNYKITSSIHILYGTVRLTHINPAHRYDTRPGSPFPQRIPRPFPVQSRIPVT